MRYDVNRKTLDECIRQEIEMCEYRMKHVKMNSKRSPLSDEVLYFKYNYYKKLLNLYDSDREKFKVVYDRTCPVEIFIWPDMRNRITATVSNCRTLKCTELTEDELDKAKELAKIEIDNFLSKELG